MPALTTLMRDARQCTRCAPSLPLGPRPVFQLHASARILIAAQAPSRTVHDTGIPFNDASGERLRAWLGVSREVFYDATRVALVPMGFCFPGTGRSGDLPPRRECLAWRAPLLAHLKRLRLTLVIGRHAMAYHLPRSRGRLTDTVRAWRTLGPECIALPHPSPRNNGWLAHNPWFEAELLPELRARVTRALSAP